MIAENVGDFIAKLVTVPALANSSGLALGGKGVDAGLRQVALPCAWVMYAKDDADEEPFGSGGHQPGLVASPGVMKVTISILIYLPYSDQVDLLTIQFPLLETVVKAIHGTRAPSGHRWRYLGQKLALVYPDRIAYEQHYTLTALM